MHTTLALKGMHCQSCVRKLTDAFTKVPGVRSAHVTLSPPVAHLETDGPVPFEALAAAARSGGSYEVAAAPSAAPVVEAPEKKPSLYPLVLIVAFIAGTVLIAGWARGPLDWRGLMLDFMAGFFLVFSFFKFLDLRGFVDAYQSYDVLARPFRGWAFVYPFVELALGVAYLTRWNPMVTNAVTLALMLLGSVGVLKALLSKRTIRCACLGTALNLPMTTVTLVEDLGMATMALVAMIFPH